METISSLLKSAKRITKAKTDKDLAIKIGISDGKMKYARRTGQITEETAQLLAPVLNRTEEELVLIVAYWKAKDIEIREAFERLYKKWIAHLKAQREKAVNNHYAQLYIN